MKNCFLKGGGGEEEEEEVIVIMPLCLATDVTHDASSLPWPLISASVVPH